MKLLTEKQFGKWSENQLDFLKPLAAVVVPLYFLPIIGKLSVEGYIVTLQDLVPSALVVSAFQLYLINAAYDFLRKWWSK